MHGAFEVPNASGMIPCEMDSTAKPNSEDINPTKLALRERIKELACLYEIARILGDPTSTLDSQLSGVVSILPGAWQFPESCVARICFDDAEYVAGSFARAIHQQRAPIVVYNEARGSVEVGYAAKDLPQAHEGPFLEEERKLIDNIARQLAIHVERWEVELHRQGLEEQLRHADRLATIGQFAAGVAHEINEPLGSILGFAQLALKAPNLGEQLNADLTQVVDAALRAREIVRKVLLFARQTPPQMAPCNLNRVVDEAIFLLEASGERRGVEFVQDLARDLPEVHADPVQMRQVLVNLLVNAVQAIANEGTITVQTRSAEDCVELTVADTGCGIPEEMILKIFDPFFTTKEIGEGTGLGLAVVHGIVIAHRGTIQVSSEPGVGSQFFVSFPKSPGAATRARSENR